MDWKEQLSVVLNEGEIDSLDVRLVCMKDQGKWFLKRLRVRVFQAEPSVPKEIQYPSYLFLRQQMNSSDFLSLLDTFTSRPSAEELANLNAEEKLKKIRIGNWDIRCEYIGVAFSGHDRGDTNGVLTHRLLPSWNFNGNISPDLVDGRESLIASGLSHFPTPIDGQAWYLYEGALQPPNDYLPSIDISLEDSRAFFQEVEIDAKTSTLRCRCGGRKLANVTLSLFTNALQREQRQADQDIAFQLQGEPNIFSVALTNGTIWLDKRDINLNYSSFGIPKGVSVLGMSFRPGGGAIADPTSAIEAITQTDTSDVAAIATPHLKIVNSYYLNGLSQSQQSFFWALIGGGVGIVFFIAAVLFLVARPFGDATTLASVITTVGGAVVSVIAGILLRLYGSASTQAANYHKSLDRIQRFFIANSACEGLEGERKGSSREALIKKLSDL